MKPISFPDKEQIASEAAKWVAKIDRGLSNAEQLKLNRWLEESSVHGDALVKYASMWDMLDVLEPIAKILPIDVLEYDVLSGDRNHSSEKSYFKMTGIAASVLFLAVLMLFLVNGGKYDAFLNKSTIITLDSDALESGGDETQNNSFTIQKYETEIGESKVLELADGSELTLNTDTEVSVEFSRDIRRVVIVRGEAYFDVAENPLRPFVVVTSDSHVTAVGTAFNVELDVQNGTEVLVTHGRVKVDNFSNIDSLTSLESAEVFLSKGQKAHIQQQQAQVSNYDEFESALAWRDGMIVFNGETLEQVVREIDRYTSLSFRIISPEMASIQVGGFFQTGDMQNLLLILEQNFGVKSQRDGNEILLSKAL